MRNQMFHISIAEKALINGIRGYPKSKLIRFQITTFLKHASSHKRHRGTTWVEYDAALRRCANLTLWFADAANTAWQTEPRTAPGGQALYSAPATTTALMLPAVFRLALRQTRTDRVHHRPAWLRSRSSRPLDPKPPHRDLGAAATAAREQAGASADRQHGPEASRIRSAAD